MPATWLDLGQVNLVDNGATQDASKVVGLADGRILIVWHDYSGVAPGDAIDVIGRIFDADGNGGPEIVLNTAPEVAGLQITPDIAALPDGGFVVTYASNNDGTNYDIIAERYDPSGNPVPGGRIVISDKVSNSEVSPVVTALPDGGYIVGWFAHNTLSYQILARHIAPDDSLFGGLIAIGPPGMTAPTSLEIATLENGNVVATWSEPGTSGSSDVVYRVLTPGILGTYLPGAVQTVAGAGSSAEEDRPHIAALTDGGFVITYVDSQGDSDGYGIRGARYTSTGTLIASDFLVNSAGTLGDQSESRVAALDDGGFVVLWSDDNVIPNNGIYGQRFLSGGTPVGGRFIIEPDKGLGVPTFPDIALLTDGRFIVSYTDYNTNLTNSEIKASIWDPFSAQVTTSGQNARTITLSNGNLLVVWQEASFGLFFDPGNIYGRIYSGFQLQPISGVLSLNHAPHTNDGQTLSDVAALPGGGFVVAYVDSQTSGGGIIAEIFDAAGNPVATNQQYQITLDAGAQLTSQPRITAFSNGGFAVTYTILTGDGDYDVKGTYVNSFGQQLAQHYNVYSGQPDFDSQFNGALGTLPDGRMVALWEYNSSTTPTNHAPFFTIMEDSGFTRIEGVFNDVFKGTATSVEAVHQPDVAGLNVEINGVTFPGFVAVWTDEAIESKGYGIKAAVMIYDIGLGTAVSVTSKLIKVNEFEAGTQLRPRVGVLDDGTFMVAWETVHSGSGTVTVSARHFDALGNPIGDEIVILGPGHNINDISILSDGTVLVTTRDAAGNIAITEFVDPPEPSAFADSLTGTLGIDRINSLAGDDVINGRSGNDVLIGAKGNDFLIGGSGFDRLVGGKNMDYLIGGAGRDVFDFNSLKDLTKNVDTTDNIVDFVHLKDVVDLKTMDASSVLSGNNKFVWRGTDPFTKSKAGELRYEQFDNDGIANDYTVIYGDTDRDTAAEFVIKLDGLITLTSEDFVL